MPKAAADGITAYRVEEGKGDGKDRRQKAADALLSCISVSPFVLFLPFSSSPFVQETAHESHTKGLI